MRSKLFDYSFMAFGLLVQVVTYGITCLHSPSALSPLSLISGCLGVCSVCLCAQGNILTYVFGFGQVLTYTWLCVEAHLYAEVALNAYYFLTMIYGVYVWRRRMQPDSRRVQTRRLSLAVLLGLATLIAVASGGVGWLLQTYTDDPTPYLDAFTTVTAVVAQILMICAYREQWYLWFTVDIVATAMWLYVGDWCMTAQHIFWCCNCVYGYMIWRKLA